MGSPLPADHDRGKTVAAGAAYAGSRSRTSPAIGPYSGAAIAGRRCGDAVLLGFAAFPSS